MSTIKKHWRIIERGNFFCYRTYKNWMELIIFSKICSYWKFFTIIPISSILFNLDLKCRKFYSYYELREYDILKVLEEQEFQHQQFEIKHFEGWYLWKKLDFLKLWNHTVNFTSIMNNMRSDFFPLFSII